MCLGLKERLIDLYKLSIDNDAVKELMGYPPKQFKQVMKKILSLQRNPRPQDHIVLKGYPGGYRVDQGEYRILYTIDDQDKLVTVFKVGKREAGEVYRHLD